MYLGNGRMIHAPRTGKPVQIDSVYYWLPPNFFGRPLTSYDLDQPVSAVGVRTPRVPDQRWCRPHAVKVASVAGRVFRRSKEARISASASARPTQVAPSTHLPGSRSL